MQKRFFYTMIKVSAGFDPDAQAFITAANITDGTQQNAINDLVVGLKADSIWTPLKAIYPIIGGTASQHKWNLKDPRDLDAAFRLIYAGGLIHSSTGILPNGSTGYVNTNLTPSVSLSLNSTHISFYSRTNNLPAGAATDMGSFDGTSSVRIITKLSNTHFININEIGSASFANTDAKGYYIANRTASNVLNGWKQGIKVINSTNVSLSLANDPIYFCAQNYNTLVRYGVQECVFATVGDGFTDTDAANLNTRVQAFQTALGRQV